MSQHTNNKSYAMYLTKSILFNLKFITDDSYRGNFPDPVITVHYFLPLLVSTITTPLAPRDP